MGEPTDDSGRASRAYPAPGTLLAVAMTIGLAVAIGVTWIASAQPWLGLELAVAAEVEGAVVHRARGPSAAIPKGTTIAGIAADGGEFRLRAEDLVVEPDGSMGTYEQYERFLARQGELARLLASRALSLESAEGQIWRVAPEPRRPLSSLPAEYWVQVVVGVFAFLIAASIWAFRPREPSARYVLLSGIATLTFAPLAAVYSTRELALPAELFRWLNDLNFLGGSLFAAALVALLLTYPRRLAPRWLGGAVLAVFVGWFVAQQLGAFASMTLARRLLVMIGVFASFGLAAAQYRATRRDPLARAALQWLLLSWLVCTSVFGLLILLPQLFGIDTSAMQGYGFLLFLLVYVGLAFGILKFRLFDLGQWWLRAVLWSVSLVALVALDLVFLLVLQLPAGASLGLALLLCGLIWLPLRGWLWGRFLPREAGGQRALFERVVEVAMTRGNEARTERWHALLRAVFEPLHLRLEPAGGEVTLHDQGVALTIPQVADLEACRLEYARSGKRLFDRRDVAMARELAGMLRHVIDSHDAYERGVNVERRRIARDMHDNLGAQLISALCSPGLEQKDRIIRASVSELRALIDGRPEASESLVEALAGVRREAAERLKAAGIELSWPISGEVEGFAHPGTVHTLRSIVRELVSNVIKHARARKVRVSIAIEPHRVRLSVADDGVGFAADARSPGHGLDNVRSRVEALGGEVRWVSAPGEGTRIEIELPRHLQPQAPNEQMSSGAIP